MSTHQIQLALWLLQPALQSGIAVIVFRRKLHKDFPVFFIYTLTQIALFAIEFPVSKWCSSDVYFYTFWIAAAVNVILAFKIIHEVFLDIFRPYPALRALGTPFFNLPALIFVLFPLVSL